MNVHVYTSSGWVDRSVHVYGNSGWQSTTIHHAGSEGWDNTRSLRKSATPERTVLKDKNGDTYIFAESE